MVESMAVAIPTTHCMAAKVTVLCLHYSISNEDQVYICGEFTLHGHWVNIE